MSMDVSQTTTTQTTAVGGSHFAGSGDADRAQDQQPQTFSPDSGGCQSGPSGGGGGLLQDLTKLLKSLMSLFSGGLGGLMGG